MPASPPPAAPSHPQIEIPKLRSSCDGCGTAKVKCDRGHPLCRRCENLGLPCVYGLSRKFGKPPRKRPAADLDATSEERVRTSWTAQSRHHQTPTGFEELPRITSPPLANFSDLAVDVFPNPYGIDAMLGTNEQDQLLSGFYPSLPLNLWPQLDNLGGALELSSAPSAEPIRNATATSDSHKSHSCPRESYEIFRDLICPSPSLHAPDSNSVTVPAQLDLVLHANREAIGRLGRLLKCPCAKSGHRAMVHASIVSRILIWYQQAAGWSCCSSWGPQPSALASPSTSRTVSSSSSTSPPPSETAAETSANSQPSLVQATGFSVEHVPVSMGTFGIEDHNVQDAIRNQLVLSELKKTAHLIDMFTSPDLGESSASGVADLYSYLGAWLRSEHSRTIKILTCRLGALNKNLVS